MIDKTKKRSLFVRIAFVLFAVALAFCSVSLALNEGKYKADAATAFFNDYTHSFYGDTFVITGGMGSSYLIPIVIVSNNGSSFSVSLSSSTPASYSIAFSDDSYYYHVVSAGSANSAYVYIDKLSSFDDYDFTTYSSFEILSDFTVPSFAVLSGDTSLAIYHFEGFDFYVYYKIHSLPSTFYNSTGVSPVPDEPVINAVTDVWTSIFTWLTTSVNSLLGLLFINGELTILGVLVVMSLGISIFFLLLAVVSNFFHLRS